MGSEAVREGVLRTHPVHSTLSCELTAGPERARAVIFRVHIWTRLRILSSPLMVCSIVSFHTHRTREDAVIETADMNSDLCDAPERDIKAFSPLCPTRF